MNKLLLNIALPMAALAFAKANAEGDNAGKVIDTGASKSGDVGTGETMEIMAPVETMITDLNGVAFKVAKKVTLPLLKQEAGEDVMIQITSEIYVGKELKAAAGNTVKEKPADLIRCIDLNSGIEHEYIVNAIVKAELEENYPDAGYKDKYFAIRKMPKPEGKRYNAFQIMELEQA